MEEAHEMVGHHFDQLRGQFNTHPIRKGWRPYKISTARTEGFAFALEELLMHAGYLDDQPPRAREIAYGRPHFEQFARYLMFTCTVMNGIWTMQ